MYCEELRESVNRPYDEETEVYERLAHEYPEVNKVRGLPAPAGRNGSGGLLFSPVGGVFMDRAN